MKKFSFALLSLGLLWACNEAPAAESSAADDASSKIETLRSEVMALHDQVMPEMAPMGKLQGELMTASVGSADSMSYMTAAMELKYAKDAMMKWMREFDSNFDENWDDTAQIEFMEGEKMKMERIIDITEKALSNGQGTLKNLNATEVQADSTVSES
jgi:hypothetical protein